MKNTSLIALLLTLALGTNACNTQNQSESEQATATETVSTAPEATELETTEPEATVETTGTEPGIQFSEATWKAHLAKAKAEKKIVFLDAYTTWCGPCKMLQKNVFTQKAVADFFNKEFINVKIDMEAGEGPELAMQYPIEGYPTLMFIDGNGKVIKTVLGYQTPEQLLSIGKTVKSEAAL